MSVITYFKGEKTDWVELIPTCDVDKKCMHESYQSLMCFFINCNDALN